MTLQPLTGKSLKTVQLSTARLNIWEGSVRSGKTVSSLIAWLKYVRTGPSGNLLMVGKTERTLKRNIIDPLTEWLGPKRCRYIQGSGELWILGRRIYIAGANDESAQDRIRGITLVGAYVDEVTVLPESFWRMLGTRLSAPDAQLFATTNPDAPRHWFHDHYLKRSQLWLKHDGTIERNTDPDTLNLNRYSFNLNDNPTLTPEFIAALEAEYTGLWHQRFIQGLWVLADGVIWSSFQDPAHVATIDQLPEMVDHVVGIDYGTHGVHAAILLGVGADNRLYVVDEWRWEHAKRNAALTDVEMSQHLRQWLNTHNIEPSRIAVDPSASSLIEQMNRHGWRRIRNADNRVLPGLQSTSSLFGQDRLHIVNTATGLLDEIPGYVWDTKANGDKPLKENDHSCDALRYAVMASRRYWRHWLHDDKEPDVDVESDPLAA